MFIENAKNCGMLVLLFFAVSKKFLLEFTWVERKIVLYSLSCLLAGILSYISFSVVIIFGIYRYFIELHLKKKHGDEFMGFISECDLTPILLVDDGKSAVINVVSIISPKCSIDEFYDRAIDRLFERLHVDIPRAFSTRESFMSYPYLIKCGIDKVLEIKTEVFKKLSVDKKTLSQRDVNDIIDKYSNHTPLPMDNKFNFDAVLITTPIEGSVPKYLAILRCHHSLVDGITLHNTVSDIFAEPNINVESVADKYIRAIENKIKNQKFQVKLKHYPALSPPNNLLIDSKGTSNAFTAVFAETNENLIAKIKVIKNTFDNVAFINVINCAFAAAVSDFFIERKVKVPEDVYIVTPVQIKEKRFGKNSYKTDTSGNECTILMTTVPIVPNNKIGVPTKDWILERLLNMRDNLMEFANTLDLMVIYLIKNYMRYNFIFLDDVCLSKSIYEIWPNVVWKVIPYLW